VTVCRHGEEGEACKTGFVLGLQILLSRLQNFSEIESYPNISGLWTPYEHLLASCLPIPYVPSERGATVAEPCRRLASLRATQCRRESAVLNTYFSFFQVYAASAPNIAVCAA
jgi:hypothetical protein